MAAFAHISRGTIDLSLFARNDPIALVGRAFKRSNGEPAASVPVKIVVAVDGFERSYDAYTNANGDFSRNFRAEPRVGGRYQKRKPGSTSNLSTKRRK